MSSSKGDDDNDACGGLLPTSSLIEIVTDAVAMTNMNMTTSSHSFSSRGDHGDEEEEVSCEFPALLRRVGSFPVTTTPAMAPPRRPSRSTSLERQESCRSFCSEDEDEIDHHKFRQLLLGTQLGGQTDVDVDEKEQEQKAAKNYNQDEEEGGPAMVALRERKSSCSAPPKIPTRSDSESVSARRQASLSASSIPSAPGHPYASLSRINRGGGGERRQQQQQQRKQQRQSLPSTVFRPLRAAQRRRRQRSFIQEMLTPEYNSEGSSKSLRLPPKLPSRSESEKSTDGGGRRPSNCSASARSIPTSVFCGGGSSAASCAAETASSSQKSTGSTDAPKRPRRSLSPIFGESVRSLMDPHPTNTEPTSAGAGAAVELESQKIPAEEVLLLQPTATTTKQSLLPQSPPSIESGRKRKSLPTRAKTFSFNYDYDSPKKCSACNTGTTTTNSCIAMLYKNWEVGRDFTGSPVSKDRSLESEWTATTWPKPRRTKVAPGRSRTFSFFVNKPQQLQLAQREDCCSDASSAVVTSRCG